MTVYTNPNRIARGKFTFSEEKQKSENLEKAPFCSGEYLSHRGIY
jgi:hypothetical protein